MLVMRKNKLTFTITLAGKVMEWYVDVKDDESGLEAHDWYDYGGYEPIQSEAIDRDMANDLLRFLQAIVERPLRFRTVDLRKRRGALDWKDGSIWKQLVPKLGP